MAKHDGKEWNVYFLQSISRLAGDVKKVITIDITIGMNGKEWESERECECQLQWEWK